MTNPAAPLSPLPNTAASTAPGARRLLHIFKPGRWTTMGGEVIEFSEADLAATAKAYNPSISKAPIVIGHPATDDPAKGWAQTLSFNARGLFAGPAKVDPAFAEEVRDGRWGTVSSKFYRPHDANNPVPGVWYLRHIGFLGAQNPAIKGLDDPEFAETDDGCVCFQEGVAFGEWDGLTNASLWRNLREWLINKFGTEEADKVLPGHEVRSLELGAQQDINPGSSAFADPDQIPAALTAPLSQPPQESDVTEEEAARLREEAATANRRVTELEAQHRASIAASALAANTAFAEQMVSEFRIPSEKAAPVAAMATQLEATPVEFGEGDAKQPLSTLFKDFVRGLPPMANSGEQASSARAAGDLQEADADVAFAEGADPDRMKQHKAVLAYQKEHKTSYAAAARAVIK